jgi:hypothetical protein
VPKIRYPSRKGAIRLACFLGFAAILALGGWSCMLRMPGASFSGPLPPLTPEQAALAAALRADVGHLAGRIGIRNALAHSDLMAAADWVEGRMKEAGLAPARQTFSIGAKPFHNLEAEVAGGARREEIVVVGAHYDSVLGCPGANDNATGTAALLALAAKLARERPPRTLRFVAFTNEEPPHFLTAEMGSLVYARRCRQRNERIAAMVSLETIGYYSDREGSQRYPPPLSLFYPSQGDFIAFVGNLASRKLVREAVRTFREHASFPSEGAALPGWLAGVGWSDHWSFWEQDYPAIMVTDTAPFRYPHYHLPEDTPEKIDYERMARAVEGLEKVVRSLAGLLP